MAKQSKEKTAPCRFVAYITLPNGRRIYAWQYGKKAFPIVDRKAKDNQ